MTHADWEVCWSKFMGGSKHIWIQDANGNTVCDLCFESNGIYKLHPDAEEHAKRIASDHNSHEELLEALCETQKVIRAAIRAGDWVINEARSPDQAFVNSVAAIKSARGQQ